MRLLKNPLLYVIIALVGTFVGVGLLRPADYGQSVSQPDAKIQQAQAQKGNSEETRAPAAEQNRAGADYYAADCKKPRDHDAADLCQQIRMADAAETQNRVNAFGLGALIMTLVATGIAAYATWQTFQTMRDTAKRELRARISVLPEGINQLIASGEGMGHVALSNVGKLPARNVALYVEMKVADDREEDFYFPPRFEKIDRVVQPGTEMRQGSKQKIPVAQLCTAGHYVYVWGVAYYEDGYGFQRFTRFGHRYATASYNRSIDWNEPARETRSILDPDKARFHTEGNDAD